MLGQRITGDVWNPTRSLELGAFGFLIDGPLRHLLSQMDRKSAAAELAGKVKSSVSSAMDGKAWVPMLACVAIAALKAADGDPAALVHSCEVQLLSTVAAAVQWCLVSLKVVMYATYCKRRMMTNSARKLKPKCACPAAIAATLFGTEEEVWLRRTRWCRCCCPTTYCGP